MPEQPHVGIFFAVGDRLLIDSVPLQEAGWYGAHQIHELGHDAYWDSLVRAGEVTGEYPDFSRGRVAYDTRKDRFTFLADRCILQQPKIVAEMFDRMHLPANTVRDRDDHYLCPRCTRKMKK